MWDEAHAAVLDVEDRQARAAVGLAAEETPAFPVFCPGTEPKHQMSRHIVEFAEKHPCTRLYDPLPPLWSRPSSDVLTRKGSASRTSLRSSTGIVSRFRVVSFRMADVMAGSPRENGETVFGLAPKGKCNTMRPRLSEREQAPALHSGANPQSPAHFGVRRLAAALSPRALAATSEQRSLPYCALSPPE
jgi:hypothetical protein